MGVTALCGKAYHLFDDCKATRGTALMQTGLRPAEERAQATRDRVQISYMKRLSKYIKAIAHEWYHGPRVPYAVGPKSFKEWLEWCVPHIEAELHVFPIYHTHAPTDVAKHTIAVELCYEAWEIVKQDHMRRVHDNDSFYSLDSSDLRRDIDSYEKDMGSIEGAHRVDVHHEELGTMAVETIVTHAPQGGEAVQTSQPSCVATPGDLHQQAK